MSHRIGQGIEGITGFHRVSSVFGGRTAETAFFGKSIAFFVKIMAIFGNIFVIFTSFLAVREVIFGFHRVSRASQGFTGFHRVSSAESASRHSSAGYVFEASPRWRAESVGWNTYNVG